MPISQDLLNILCCPVTKVSVKMLSRDKLELVNRQIAARKVKDVEGIAVDQPLQEALVTTDNKTIYRIDDDIPVMLVGSGIPTDQVQGF